MPQFTTTTTIYDMVYLETTGLVEGDLRYEFEKDGLTKSITLVLTETQNGWYSINFICDEQTDNLTLSLNYGNYNYSFKYVIGDSEYSETQSGSKLYYQINLGKSGLLIGDIVATVYKNKTTDPKIVNFEEEQDNFYEISFTPDADDFWFLTVDYKAYRILLSDYCAAAPAGGGTTINVQASTTNQVSANSSTYTIVRASS